MSTLSLAIYLYFIRLAIYLVLAFISLIARRKWKPVEKLKKGLFFNDLLILVLEGYIEFLICGYLNIQEPLRESTFSGEALGYFQSLFCLGTATLLPLWFIIVLFVKDLAYFRTEGYETTFGVMTEGLKTESKKQIMYYIVFMIRRFAFFAIAVGVN